MKKILGIVGLLVAICAFTALSSDRFVSVYNIENLLRRTALFGIIGIGAAFVIITGGIDLSIGSLIGLTGVLLPMLLKEHGTAAGPTLAISLWLAGTIAAACGGVRWKCHGGRHGLRAVLAGVALLLLGFVVRGLDLALPGGLLIGLVVLWVLILSASLGLAHGLLITRLRLQPFVVTLCGLLIYRGLARGISDDRTVGFGSAFPGLKALASGKVGVPGTDFGIPAPCFVLAAVAILAALFLNRTIWGRYLRALGNNEEATRLSGIDTRRMIVLAYVLCASLAGFGGLLFVLDLNSAQPASHGNFYELYAIAAAVLGGCSLRGGEGSIVGVVAGAAVMQVLYNSINLLGIPTQLEFAIIGAVILAGVSTDELVRRVMAARLARAERENVARPPA